MVFFRKSSLVLAASLSLAASGLMVSSGGASAASVIGTEDPASGFVGDLLGPTAASGIIVASDGEATFDPFQFGADTSDGIQFPVAMPLVAVPGNLWTQLAGTNTWVLPANLSSIGCGVENNVTCEPVGQWIIDPSVALPLGQFAIHESDGSFSDLITLSQEPGGGTLLTFVSDPVPEPAIWAMLLIGFFGVGFMMRRGSSGQALAAA